MTISLYTASVPVFERNLKNALLILEKTASHVEEMQLDPDSLLNAQLFPDMYPMIRQVQIFNFFANDVPARLAGFDGANYAFREETFVELRDMLHKPLAYLATFTPPQIDGQEARDIVVGAGTPQEKKYSGESYLLSYGLPNFFFHLSMMYANARHCGVTLGKYDYLGRE